MKNVKCAETSKSLITFYFAALAMKSIAIAMPHAFLTLIFLDKGMDYSKIAIIQAFYSFGVVIFEYPSGVLADKYPKKYIYIMSLALLTVTYLLVLNTDRYLFLIAAWLIYGISTATETGTIDSDIIIWIKENNDTEEISQKIKKFIGTSGQVSSISAIGGACLGFVLYKIIDINIYWVMTALILFAGLLIAIFYKIPVREKTLNKRNIMAIVKDSFKEIKETKELQYMMLLFALFQVFLQIHYQLWQSLFIEYGIKSDWFIFIYLGFQFLSIVAYKVPVNKIFKKTAIPVMGIGIVAVILMYMADKPIIRLLLYAVPVFSVSIAAYFVETKYNEIIKVGNISSVTSLFSTVMRIFGFCTLLISSRFIELFSIRALFLVIPLVVFVMVCFILDRHIINFSLTDEK